MGPWTIRVAAKHRFFEKFKGMVFFILVGTGLVPVRGQPLVYRTGRQGLHRERRRREEFEGSRIFQSIPSPLVGEGQGEGYVQISAILFKFSVIFSKSL